MAKKFTPPVRRADFAKLLSSRVEVRPGYASELAGGIKKPSLDLAVKFERVYGIPPSFWVERAA